MHTHRCTHTFTQPYTRTQAHTHTHTHTHTGEVSYDPCGFLVKNKDELLEDTRAAMKTSTLSLVQALFSAEADSQNGSPPQGGSRKKGGATLSKLFTTQLESLMSVLRSSTPHFIRCIKPNTNKSPIEFDPTLVMQQLQFAGVIDAVGVRKHGYPFRRTHAAFVSRYLLLLGHEDKKRMAKEGGGENMIARCERLVQMLGQQVEWPAVQGSAVQCSAVQCSAVQCSAVQCSAAHCSAVQCSAVQRIAV